jgi:hypothetical protein
MVFAQNRIAQLDDAQLAQVQTLEEQLGGWIVALNQFPRLAQISDDKLKQIQAIEEQLGVILLAFESSRTDAKNLAHIRDSGIQPLNLSEEQLKQLQSLETGLRLILLAYEQVKLDS